MWCRSVSLLVERDILRESRGIRENPGKMDLDSVQSRGTVGNSFDDHGNGRERFAICGGGWRRDGTDSSFKHLPTYTSNVNSA